MNCKECSFMAMVVAEFDILCLLLSGGAKRTPKEAGFWTEISCPKTQKRSASLGGGGGNLSAFLTPWVIATTMNNNNNNNLINTNTDN
jgi:hypothetical protein